MNQWGAGPFNHQHQSLGSEESQKHFLYKIKLYLATCYEGGGPDLFPHKKARGKAVFPLN